MINRIVKAALIAGLAFGLGNTAYAAQAVSLDELLQQVKSGRVKDAEENRKRIAEFQQARGQQQQLLRNMEASMSDVHIRCEVSEGGLDFCHPDLRKANRRSPHGSDLPADQRSFSFGFTAIHFSI